MPLDFKDATTRYLLASIVGVILIGSFVWVVFVNDNQDREIAVEYCKVFLRDAQEARFGAEGQPYLTIFSGLADTKTKYMGDGIWYVEGWVQFRNMPAPFIYVCTMKRIDSEHWEKINIEVL